jgi:7-cyano-7-deazaguanine reductase
MDELKSLGKSVVYKFSYNADALEAFENRDPENDYWVKFYIPDLKMVESKSLKLYLFSFRNHGAFHEDCVNIIMKELIRLMEPRYIEVWGKFSPRGGISIDPWCNFGKPDTKFRSMAEYRMLNHDLNPEKTDNR